MGEEAPRRLRFGPALVGAFSCGGIVAAEIKGRYRRKGRESDAMGSTSEMGEQHRLELNQRNGRLTLTLHHRELGMSPMNLISDMGAPFGVSWWLEPELNLREILKGAGCSDAGIRQIYESAASKMDMHLFIDLPS